MLRVIKVEELNRMGFESGTKYFRSLNKAKKYFKQLIKSHKEDLADECSYLENPIEYKNYKKDFIQKPVGRYKAVSLECWYSSETDCGTEWDTEPIEIILTEIKIEDSEG